MGRSRGRGIAGLFPRKADPDRSPAWPRRRSSGTARGVGLVLRLPDALDLPLGAGAEQQLGPQLEPARRPPAVPTLPPVGELLEIDQCLFAADIRIPNDCRN